MLDWQFIRAMADASEITIIPVTGKNRDGDPTFGTAQGPIDCWRVGSDQTFRSAQAQEVNASFQYYIDGVVTLPEEFYVQEPGDVPRHVLEVEDVPLLERTRRQMVIIYV